MALTPDEKSYLDRLSAAGAKKEDLTFYLNKRREKEQSMKPGIIGKTINTLQNIGGGAIQAGGELAVGLPGQLSRLAPGNQSADKGSFYNLTQGLLEGTKNDMTKQGIDTDSLAYGAGKGVMNIAAASVLGGGVSNLLGKSKTLSKLSQYTPKTLLGKSAVGGLRGAAEGLSFDAASGTTPGIGTVAGGVFGAAMPLAGQAIKSIGGATGKYFNKLPKNTSKTGAYTEGKAGKFIQDAADSLSTKFNRIDPTKEIEFEKMTGEKVGQFLNKRGIYEAGDATVDKVSNLFAKSLKEADEGLALIQGKFKMNQGGDDLVQVAIDDLVTKLNKELSPQRGIIKEFADKYASGGLTQTELNQLKRLYQNNNKFGYLKEAVDPSGVARATNILDGIRNWQFSTAAKEGFTNLGAVNKNTQAFKFLSKEIQKKMDKSQANNTISLTDWIVATGSPYGFGGVVGKKILSSDKAKGLLLKGLNNGRQGIEPLVKADREGIIKQQVNKVYGLSDNSYSDLNFSSTLDRKGVRTLPPPSGKPLTGSNVIDVKPISGMREGGKYTEITPRSKIIQPGTYTEPKPKLRTNEDALAKPIKKEVKANLPKTPQVEGKTALPMSKKSNGVETIANEAKKYKTEAEFIDSLKKKMSSSILPDDFYPKKYELPKDGGMGRAEALIKSTEERLAQSKKELGMARNKNRIAEIERIIKRQEVELQDKINDLNRYNTEKKAYSDALDKITNKDKVDAVIRNGKATEADRELLTFMLENRDKPVEFWTDIYKQSKPKPSLPRPQEGKTAMEKDVLDIQTGRPSEIAQKIGMSEDKISLLKRVEEAGNKLSKEEGRRIRPEEAAIHIDLEDMNNGIEGTLEKWEKVNREVQPSMIKFIQKKYPDMSLLPKAKEDSIFLKSKPDIKKPSLPLSQKSEVKYSEPVKELEPVIKATQESRFVKKPVAIKKDVYRGVSNDEYTGKGMATYGNGLYTTTNKSIAKEYAGSNGKLLEISKTQLPENALHFDTVMDYKNWLDYDVQKKLGMKASEFNAKYPDIGEFIKSLGYDGIVVGKGEIMVTYP